MTNEIFYIKNMVCNRCIMVVSDQFTQLGLHPVSVELGQVIIQNKSDENQRKQLKDRLEQLGFELIDNKRIRLIEQIKNAVIELVHYRNSDLKINLSDYLTEKVNHDYSYLSNLFSEIENTTIERYFIAQKIEKVKELLAYNELSLTEIADLLNYSSVSHLSAQFKKLTGYTTSEYKKQTESSRKPLDKI